MVGDIDAHVGQGRIVVRPEGAQVFRTAFGRAVGAEQTVLEIERHFGNGGAAVDAGRSDFDGRHQVFAPVGAQHADRNLAAGEDDGFGQVFEQEAQGRSGVGHRVGAVQHDEPVVAGVVVADDRRQVEPVAGLTFDESITGSIVNTSMPMFRLWRVGNSSKMPLKSNGTRAPVVGSGFMPIVPPV